MPRRRNENGLKRQQRIESEQQRRIAPNGYVAPDDRAPEEVQPAPVPPGVTQAFENLAPPAIAPRKDE
jgi:hypothetical protein